MAEATFILRAIDSTKAAFASVQNSLEKLKASSQIVGGFLKKAFSPMALGTGLAAAFGLSMTSMIDELVKKLIDAFNRAKLVADILGKSAKEVKEIQKQAAFDLMSPAEQLLALEKDRADMAGEIKRLTEATAVAVQTVATNMGGLGSVMRGVKEQQQGTVEEAKKLAELNKLDAQNATAILKVKKEITEAQKKIAEDLQKKILKDEEDVRNQKIKTLEDVYNKQDQAFNDILKFQQQANDESEKKRKIDTDAGEALRQLASDQLDAVNPLRLYVRELELVKKLTDEGLITQSQKIARDKQINEEMAETARLLTLTPAQKQFHETARDAGSLISQGFEDAILSGQKLGEVVRSLGRDLLRLVFSQMVTRQLANVISVALGAPPIPGLAMGGPVSAGSPYVVGERGPELFVPSSSGSIVPNSKMSSGGGGGMGGVTVNYNIAAGVSRSELVPILEQERRRLKAEIPDMVRRGGSYRSAFA